MAHLSLSQHYNGLINSVKMVISIVSSVHLMYAANLCQMSKFAEILYAELILSLKLDLKLFSYIFVTLLQTYWMNLMLQLAVNSTRFHLLKSTTTYETFNRTAPLIRATNQQISPKHSNYTHLYLCWLVFLCYLSVGIVQLLYTTSTKAN